MDHERVEPDARVDERREYVRYAENTRILFLEEGAAAPTAGRLRDLSLGGVCLTTPREVSVGITVYLGIFFQHLQNGPLIIVARVQRCSSEEGGFALGLEFVCTTNAQGNALGRVRQYLVEQHGG